MSYTTLSLNRPIPRIERRFGTPDASDARLDRDIDSPFLAVALLANLIYLFASPSLAAKVVALFGGLTAAVLAAWLWTPSMKTARGRSWLLPAVVFALPLASLAVTPTIVFWRLDARAWLVLGWLVVLSAPQRAIPGERPGQQTKRTVRLALFSAWAALFWLMLIWDLGVGRVVLNLAREERVLWTARLWDTRPVSDHLFLVWLSDEAFARGEAYTNHPLPFAALLYATTKAPQLLADLPLYVGRNLIPFALMAPVALAAAALAARTAGTAAIGRQFYLVLFLAVGVLVSDWHFWNTTYRYNFDNVFPLVAILTAIVLAAARRGASRHRALPLVLATAALALFGWIYTPLVLLALWCCHGRIRPSLPETLRSNEALVRATIAGVAVTMAVVLVPLVLVAMRGYVSTSSSVLFRSGLDGDTRYFRDAMQAVLAPSGGTPRGWWSLLFPAFAPVVAALAVGWPWSRTARYRIFVQTIFLFTPYLFSLAVFPQSVSIHPYLYDQLLFLPAVLIGVTWWLDKRVQHRLKGATVLAALVLVIVLLMANFIAVAQVMRDLLPA